MFSILIRRVKVPVVICAWPLIQPMGELWLGPRSPCSFSHHANAITTAANSSTSTITTMQVCFFDSNHEQSARGGLHHVTATRLLPTKKSFPIEIHLSGITQTYTFTLCWTLWNRCLSGWVALEVRGDYVYYIVYDSLVCAIIHIFHSVVFVSFL